MYKYTSHYKRHHSKPTHKTRYRISPTVNLEMEVLNSITAGRNHKNFSPMKRLTAHNSKSVSLEIYIIQYFIMLHEVPRKLFMPQFSCRTQIIAIKIKNIIIILELCNSSTFFKLNLRDKTPLLCPCQGHVQTPRVV